MPTQANVNQLRKDLARLGSAKKAKASAWFFKTGVGEYGHGDVFLGVTVPQQRLVAKQYRDLPLKQVLQLLRSKVHEHRLTAVFILVDQFRRGGEVQKKKIVQAYVASRAWINNWDIVDSSAPHVLGTYLLDQPRQILYQLARSKNIWERRMAIIATQTFIRAGQYQDTLKLAKVLLQDQHDLIHKAVGWMLREIGDRDRATEVKFLRSYDTHMPRTMLRYAVEKFPQRQQTAYLSQKKTTVRKGGHGVT